MFPAVPEGPDGWYALGHKLSGQSTVHCHPHDRRYDNQLTRVMKSVSYVGSLSGQIVRTRFNLEFNIYSSEEIIRGIEFPR